MNNISKVVVALAAGVAVGAVLGILFAPAKGEETRKKMGEEGKKMADALKNKYREAKEKFERAGEDMKEKMDEYA
jgi:gas vesicle protein